MGELLLDGRMGNSDLLTTTRQIVVETKQQARGPRLGWDRL